MDPDHGRIRRCIVLVWLSVLAVLMLPAGADASAGDEETMRRTQRYLRSLPLDELMRLDVTTVSRRPEPLAGAAAAVFVVTAEDIRSSGVTTIPDALRMVPGLQVARIDANKWVVSSRGFGNRFSNNLLVLVDGRTVYRPVFSGVYWDELDIPLELIEQIEVIRGPGGAVWGANAVNGVINIVTRSSADTQGTRVSAGGGNLDRVIATLSHGGRIGEDTSYRAYARYRERASGASALGVDGEDDWTDASFGLRLDGRSGARDSWMIDSRVGSGRVGQTIDVPVARPWLVETFDDPVDTFNAYLLGRWDRQLSDTSSMRLQSYVDYARRDDPAGRQRVTTFDIDFQHNFLWLGGQQVTWGIELRYIDHHVTQWRVRNAIDPERRYLKLFSAFVQDEIPLLDNRLRLTLGAKLEQNDFTGLELQPSVRLAWTPSAEHTIWGAVSRAVRTPSVFERGSEIPFFSSPGRLTTLVSVVGNEDYDAENLISYEAGYRFYPSPGFNLDLSVYYNDYSDLRTAEVLAPQLRLSESPPHVFVAGQLGNRMDGDGWGVELASNWQASETLRFQLAYTYGELNLNLDPGFADLGAAEQADFLPDHQFSLRANWDLNPHWELDAWVRHVSSRAEAFFADYTTLDLRLGWRAARNLELSLVGQNLIGTPGIEFTSFAAQQRATEAERALFLKLDWKI